jgi:hypothetical protein
MAKPTAWKLPMIEARIAPDAMVFNLSFVRNPGLAAQALPGVTEETISDEIRGIRSKILEAAQPHLERLARLKLLEGEYIDARMATKAASVPPSSEVPSK